MGVPGRVLPDKTTAEAMRLFVEFFGREFTVSLTKAAATDDSGEEHDNTAAQVETARSDWPDYYAADCFGFGKGSEATSPASLPTPPRASTAS